MANMEKWDPYHAAFEKLAKERDDFLAAGYEIGDKEVADKEAEMRQNLIEAYPIAQESDALLNALIEHNSGILSSSQKEKDSLFLEINANLHKVANLVYALAIASFIVIVFSISMFVQNLLREIRVVANAVESGDLRARGLPQNVPVEMKSVVEAFNNTLESVFAPIQECLHVLKRMTSNDFSQKATGLYKGDLALLKDGVNSSIDTVSELLTQIASAVEQLQELSSDIDKSSDQLMGGSQTQAAALEEINSSMVEVAERAQKNNSSALEANSLATLSKENSDTSRTQMANMISSMEGINSSSEHISKIIKVIDEIAFQTNLLALNASVEAARAGAHGRGFAVVADEVRNLASRSANAAKETEEIISDSRKRIAVGTNMAETTSQSLQDVLSNIQRITERIQEIVRATKEQGSSVNQILEGLSQVNNVAQNTTLNASNLTQTAQKLSLKSSELNSFLSSYKFERLV